MAKDIRIVQDSQLGIKGIKNKEHVHIDIDTIKKVEKIAPIAAHIKEINHIDPLRIEELHLNEIRNIDPVKVEKFNITNLPMVNVSLRQIPAVDMNVRRLPPLSLGMYQNFQIPSNYIVRAKFLGFEVFRVYLNGQTSLLPKERYRCEQARTQNKSFPEPTPAGNPAIPSICLDKSTSSGLHSAVKNPDQAFHQKQTSAGSPAKSTLKVEYEPAIQAVNRDPEKSSRQPSLNFGQPALNFSMSGSKLPDSYSRSSVSSGG